MGFYKYIFINLLIFLFSISITKSQDAKEVLERYNYQESSSYYGPVEFAKKIINDTKIVWSPVGKAGVKINYVLGKSPLALDAAGYILIESPKLATQIVAQDYVGPTVKVTKDFATRVIQESIQSPKILCKKITRATIIDGFNDYEVAYNIAQSYLKTGELSVYDALTFLDRRWGLFKLPAAAKLYSSSYNYTPDDAVANAIIDEAGGLVDAYAEMPISETAIFIKDLYDLQKKYKTGLLKYPPYIEFNKNMDAINKLRLNEAERWQPAIKITVPNSKTKWDLNEGNIQITWNSRHLQKTDLVSFYLIKNDERITKLGPFKNTGIVSDIISLLNRNRIHGGDDYYLYAYIESCGYYSHPDFSNLIETKSELFKISGKLSIIMDDVESQWNSGTFENVNWESNYTGNATFQLKQVNKTNVEKSITIYSENGSNSLKFPVPHNASGANYKLYAYIKGKLAGTSNVFSISQSNNNTDPFAIDIMDDSNIHGRESITRPTAFTTWYTDQMIDVVWNFKSEGNIGLELLKGGQLFSYYGDFANTLTSIDFIGLPDNVVVGNDYQIKIYDTENRDNFLISEKFSIIKRKELYSKANNYSRLKHSSFAGRNINYVADMEFSSNNLTIYFWDHETQDGDIISLYLNGTPIIENHPLTNRKQAISVSLDPTKPNELFLFAVNEGKYPPNTAALEITDGIKKKPIVLESNMTSCEGIVIRVK